MFYSNKSDISDKKFDSNDSKHKEDIEINHENKEIAFQQRVFVKAVKYLKIR